MKLGKHGNARFSCSMDVKYFFEEIGKKYVFLLLFCSLFRIFAAVNKYFAHKLLNLKLMKRKEYKKPTTQVVKLQQAPQLLQASRPDYYPEPW